PDRCSGHPWLSPRLVRENLEAAPTGAALVSLAVSARRADAAPAALAGANRGGTPRDTPRRKPVGRPVVLLRRNPVPRRKRVAEASIVLGPGRGRHRIDVVLPLPAELQRSQLEIDLPQQLAELHHHPAYPRDRSAQSTAPGMEMLALRQRPLT